MGSRLTTVLRFVQNHYSGTYSMIYLRGDSEIQVSGNYFTHVSGWDFYIHPSFPWVFLPVSGSLSSSQLLATLFPVDCAGSLPSLKKRHQGPQALQLSTPPKPDL